MLQTNVKNAKCQKNRFFCFGVYVRVCQILQYDDVERWIFSSLSSGTYLRATYKLRKNKRRTRRQNSTNSLSNRDIFMIKRLQQHKHVFYTQAKPHKHKNNTFYIINFASDFCSLFLSFLLWFFFVHLLVRCSCVYSGLRSFPKTDPDIHVCVWRI